MAKKKPTKRSPVVDVIGYRAIAKRYDVSIKTVQNWIAEGLPHSGPARRRVFRFSKTDPWVENYRKQSEPVTDDDKATRSRKERAKADQEEIKLERMRREEEIAVGNILPRDELTLAIIETVTRARDRMLSEIPREISKRFPNQRRKIFDVCAETLEISLDQLARDLEQVALDSETSEAVVIAADDRPPPPKKKKSAAKKTKKKTVKRATPKKTARRKRPKKKR